MNAPGKTRKGGTLLALNRNILMKHKLVLGATLCVIVIALLVAVGGSRGKDAAPPSPPVTGVEVAGGGKQGWPDPNRGGGATPGRGKDAGKGEGGGGRR